MKNYSFNTIFPSSGEYACQVSIDGDDIADDNHFYFDIQILNDVKISIIDNQSNMITHFNTHNKQDDLADSFLQGMYYFNEMLWFM